MVVTKGGTEALENEMWGPLGVVPVLDVGSFFCTARNISIFCRFHPEWPGAESQLPEKEGSSSASQNRLLGTFLRKGV